MLRDAKVIEFLNSQLTNELTAINQYFLHSRMLNHWGVSKLGKKEYDESIEEMRHADRLIERILFLNGLPNLQKLNRLMIGQTVEEILKADLAMEDGALTTLRDGIKHCEAVGDYISRSLLRDILDEAERQIDFLERQFDLIKLVGIERYTLINSERASDESSSSS
jgi:bacterioferritin